MQGSKEKFSDSLTLLCYAYITNFLPYNKFWKGFSHKCRLLHIGDFKIHPPDLKNANMHTWNNVASASEGLKGKVRRTHFPFTARDAIATEARALLLLSFKP